MNVYVWEYIDGLTGSYHSSGGAVVVAVSEEAAWAALVAEATKPAYEGDEPDHKPVRPEKPSAVLVTDAGAVPMVFVFPNAGCC